MARIRRINVTLNVPDDEVDYYINLGYDLIDNTGKVIRKAMPRDVATLQKYYKEHTKKIEELEAEIEKLKSEKKPLTTNENAESSIKPRGRKAVNKE